MSVLLENCHWTMRNDVRIGFKSDVSVEDRNSHFSQVEEEHTILILTISQQVEKTTLVTISLVAPQC